jgi:hypothetical protein
MQATTRIVVALERFKGLFLEIPNMKLSLQEATQISGLEPSVCRQLLAALVDVRFLSLGPDGVYRRRNPLFGDEAAPARRALPFTSAPARFTKTG